MPLRLQAVSEKPGEKPTREMTGRVAAEVIAPVQAQRLERETIELPEGAVEPRPPSSRPRRGAAAGRAGAAGCEGGERKAGSRPPASCF